MEKTTVERIWTIADWAGNAMFNGRHFCSFEEAEEFLSEHLGDNYDDERGEFYIEQAYRTAEA